MSNTFVDDELEDLFAALPAPATKPLSPTGAVTFDVEKAARVAKLRPNFTYPHGQSHLHAIDVDMAIAVDDECGIGKEGELPWPRVSADMERFKKIRYGRALIVSRRTRLTMPKDPSDCVYFEVSHSTADGRTNYNAIPEAISLAVAHGLSPIICGGGEIYKAALPYVTRIFLTEIAGVHKADTFFVVPIGHFRWGNVERVGVAKFTIGRRAAPWLNPLEAYGAVPVSSMDVMIVNRLMRNIILPSVL